MELRLFVILFTVLKCCTGGVVDDSMSFTDLLDKSLEDVSEKEKPVDHDDPEDLIQRTSTPAAQKHVVSTTAIPEQVKVCPNRWFHVNGTCHQVSRTALPWRGARRVCQTYGGDLATIRSSAHSQFLYSISSKLTKFLHLHPRDRDFWVGLYRDSAVSKTHAWHWLQKDVTFSRWDARMPDHYGSCGRLHSSGKLRTWVCDTPFRFICSRPALSAEELEVETRILIADKKVDKTSPWSVDRNVAMVQARKTIGKKPFHYPWYTQQYRGLHVTIHKPIRYAIAEHIRKPEGKTLRTLIEELYEAVTLAKVNFSKHRWFYCQIHLYDDNGKALTTTVGRSWGVKKKKLNALAAKLAPIWRKMYAIAKTHVETPKEVTLRKTLTGETCPAHWRLYGGHCYAYASVQRAFYISKQICRRYPGGHLVSLLNKQENEHVITTSKAAKQTLPYVGLERARHKLHTSLAGRRHNFHLRSKDITGGWTWSDNATLSYTNWDLSVLNGRHNHRWSWWGGCVTLRADGRWQMQSACHHARPFICKMRPIKSAELVRQKELLMARTHIYRDPWNVDIFYRPHGHEHKLLQAHTALRQWMKNARTLYKNQAKWKTLETAANNYLKEIENKTRHVIESYQKSMDILNTENRVKIMGLLKDLEKVNKNSRVFMNKHDQKLINIYQNKKANITAELNKLQGKLNILRRNFRVSHATYEKKTNRNWRLAQVKYNHQRGQIRTSYSHKVRSFTNVFNSAMGNMRSQIASKIQSWTTDLYNSLSRNKSPRELRKLRLAYFTRLNQFSNAARKG